MKHAFQLASLSVAALALSAQAGKVKTFDIDFDSYTADAAPTAVTEAAGTWTLGTGDESIVEVKSGTDKNLAVDASSSSPLTFQPSAAEATAVSMDVQFVGASTAQDPVTGSKAGIYLDKTTGKLFASVNGGAFGTTDIAVSEGAWYTVALSFNANGTVTITVSQNGSQVGTWTSSATVSSGTTVSYVDFYGSGKVDNFVGSYALDSATDTDTGTAGDTASDTDMTIANGVLTTQFASTLAGTGDLKFITVKGTDSNGTEITRTLRVVNGNQAIAITAAGFSSVSKVVAYYGNNVTATTGNAPAVTSTSVAANGTVTGSVVAKSGLYYAKEENGVKTALNGNAPIAPQNEGSTLEFTVSPSSDNYGVKKFKIVASDDPVSAQ